MRGPRGSVPPRCASMVNPVYRGLPPACRDRPSDHAPKQRHSSPAVRHGLEGRRRERAAGGDGAVETVPGHSRPGMPDPSLRRGSCTDGRAIESPGTLFEAYRDSPSSRYRALPGISRKSRRYTGPIGREDAGGENPLCTGRLLAVRHGSGTPARRRCIPAGDGLPDHAGRIALTLMLLTDSATSSSFHPSRPGSARIARIAGSSAMQSIGKTRSS